MPINNLAPKNNAHHKLYAIADDLDERAQALQRHARDLRQHADLLEAKINESRRDSRTDASRSGPPGIDPTSIHVVPYPMKD